MMAVAFGPTSCSSSLVPKSNLSHSPKVQHGFIPKLNPHGGKTVKTECRSQTCLDYAEVHPVFAGTAKNTALRAEKPKLTTRSLTFNFQFSIFNF